MRYRILFKVHKNILKYNTKLLEKVIALKIKRYVPKDAFINVEFFEFDGTNFIEDKITVTINYK